MRNRLKEWKPAFPLQRNYGIEDDQDQEWRFQHGKLQGYSLAIFQNPPDQRIETV